MDGPVTGTQSPDVIEAGLPGSPEKGWLELHMENRVRIDRLEQEVTALWRRLTLLEGRTAGATTYGENT